MHDPMVVAWDVPAPWLRRCFRRGLDRRWGLIVERRTNPENLGERVYPWWRPAGYRLLLNGDEYATRTLLVIWHVEPGGRDSGEVCRHYYKGSDGEWHVDRTWRWHVHHWRLQVPALQDARRYLLTRCSWCGERHRRRDPVNNAMSWGDSRRPWWRGESDLFHRWCASVAGAHRLCTCREPGPLSHGDYGTCAQCEKGRSWRPPGAVRDDDVTRALQTVPVGQRPSQEVVAWVMRLSDERRAAEQAS